MKQPLVLMYHGIVNGDASIPPDREDGAELYDLSLKEFCEHMEVLKSSNRSVGMILAASDTPVDVVLTFDDGEKNNFINALPSLKENDFKAYFFVTAQRVEREGYMNWEELMELRDAGFIIGAHGLTHQMLTELKKDELEQEVLASKDILEQHLKIEIKDMSVPRGFYNDNVLDAARSAGYRNIFVSQKNKPDDDVIQRVAVKSNWSAERLKMALSGRTPVGETAFNAVKDSVKKITGGGVYDKIRSTILKVKKK